MLRDFFLLSFMISFKDSCVNISELWQISSHARGRWNWKLQPR